ncbi:MAG: triple tyrosine motif-containing protein, partial [Bacteroidetes bacterium]|nr:triple tyrosine motif-containing protein [Bacteroidota bacterium]
RQGMIWTGGWGIALSCLDPATGKWSRYFPEKLPLGNILCITPDQQNRLLIGTANQGAAMFDPVRREFQLISGEDPGVGSDEHKGILKISQFNPSHEIWILSNDIAVEDKSFHSFQYVTVPYTADISCVYHDEKESLIYAGAIWCNGFYIYNESRKNWKEIRPDIHVGSHLLCVRRMLQDSKGVLWVGTRQGLMTLDKDKSKLHFVGNINGKSLNVSDSVVNTIFEDKKGNLWVGTLCEGVYRINPDRADVTFFRTRETKDHKKESWQPVKAIQEDYLGNIWIGTADGITVYNPIKNTFNRSVDDSLRSYRPSNRIIHSIVEDDQRRLWISIDHFGLMCVTITKEGKYKLSMYSTDDLGLENSIITHLYPDQKGGIWINNLNLVHFDPYTFSLRTFTEYNGLHYRMGDNVRPYADHSGTLFLPADQGFETTSVIPDPGSSAIREVVIEQVLIKGKRIPFGSNNSALHMKLDPDQNDLAFVFSAICFQNTGMINYSYFLKGYDKDWNICIANREAKYTNLPPGEYVFMVRASCQGLNNVKEARLAFTIPPHFWETWWFILLVVLLILTLLYNIYRYRLEQMLKLERLRTRIATDLHDEVASTLSGISIMSEILGKEVKENRSARMISEIGNKSMKMMEMIDDIIWVVKPVNDRFQNLGLRIMEFATPLFESKDISYSFELDEKLSGLNLPMEQRRNIYLIAKEAINNMIKYSGCSHASIVFSGKEHDLTMEIADNGCGFDPALPTSRNGIKNMRLRASQIRAEIQILSAPGEGTRIILTSKMN